MADHPERGLYTGVAIFGAVGLEDLARAPAGGVGFISPNLVTTGITKSGYTMTVATGTDATMASFYSHTEPVTVGSTGRRSFASDHRGTIFQLATGAVIPATMAGATSLQ